jgi:hypothetical protein
MCFLQESSEEVQILGESSFKNNCNSMNQQAETLYNTSLSLGSATHGKENYLPQRIPKRSKYVCSPFDVDPSSSLQVQSEQLRIWEAVTTLCDYETHNL